jgi:hypothetical protein
LLEWEAQASLTLLLAAERRPGKLRLSDVLREVVCKFLPFDLPKIKVGYKLPWESSGDEGSSSDSDEESD